VHFSSVLTRLVVGSSAFGICIAEGSPLFDVQSNAYVSVGTFVLALISTTMFLVWIAKDRWSVEKRISTNEREISFIQKRNAQMDAEIAQLRVIAESMAHIDDKLTVMIKHQNEDKP
jgi:hypothetical protein